MAERKAPKEADVLRLRELPRLSEEQFDRVARQLMIRLGVVPKTIHNKPNYYLAEVVSKKDKDREILFVNKGMGLISPFDIERLATYSEQVEARRSMLVTLGEFSRDAQKEGRRRNVKLMNGRELAEMIGGVKFHA